MHFVALTLLVWLIGLTSQDTVPISGEVRIYRTAEPIERAPITFESPTFRGDVLSDATGHFEIRLPPGEYKISFSNPLMLLMPPGEGGGPQSLVVGKEAVNELRLYRIPTGIVSGRVVNSVGNPISNLLVQAFDLRYVDGKRLLTPIVTSGMTDDRGEYRLPNVPPGRYFIRATSKRLNARFEGISYFPGTAGVNDAVQVLVKSREETDRVSWTAISAPMRTISGTLIVPGARLPDGSSVMLPDGTFKKGFWSGSTFIALIPLDGQPSEGNLDLIPIDTVTGRFEFKVFPGLYDLFVTRTARKRPEEEESKTEIRNSSLRTHIGHATIDARGADLEAIPIVLEPTVDIRGKVLVNGHSLDSSASPIVVKFVSLLGPAFNAASVPVDAKGNFLNVGLINGRHAVQLSNLPKGAYVEGVDINGTAAADLGFIVGKMDSNMTITLGLDGGAIEGTVRDLQGNVIPYAPIVLVPPLEYRWNPTFYFSAIADENGQFAIGSIRPGDYKLFSWRQVPRSRLGASVEIGEDFVEPFEGFGKPISIGKNYHETDLAITLIDN